MAHSILYNTCWEKKKIPINFCAYTIIVAGSSFIYKNQITVKLHHKILKSNLNTHTQTRVHVKLCLHPTGTQKKRNWIVSGLEKTPVNRMRFEPIFEEFEEFQAINIQMFSSEILSPNRLLVQCQTKIETTLDRTQLILCLWTNLWPANENEIEMNASCHTDNRHTDQPTCVNQWYQDETNEKPQIY